MKIDAETYRVAATEHVTLARELYLAGRYVYAIYVAGVSVECALRTSIAGEEFDAGHDLPELLRRSAMLATLPPRRAALVYAAIGNLWARWRNSHRYLSATALKRFLVRRGLHVGVKGDPVKEAARVAVASALIVVGRGVTHD